MITRSVISLLFSLGIGVQASAQADCTTVLRGTVTDEHNGRPLDFSAVYLLGAQVGTYADEAGHFEIEAPCGKTDTLLVSHVGCEDLRIPVVLDGKPTEFKLELEHHTEFLSGIEVHSHRNTTNASDAGGTLSGEQLDRSAGAHLATVLEQLPGVRTLSNGANVGRPIVDGLGGSRLQIVQGGAPLASQDWGDEHAPEIDPFAAGSVQLARAGATLRYGASTTGATLVVDDPRLPTKRGLHGQALGLAGSNARLVGSGLSVAQRLSTCWGYRAQGFAVTSGDAHAPEYVLSNTGSRRASGQARVYYVDSSLSVNGGYRGYYQEQGILRAAHIGSITDFERALTAERPIIIDPYTRSIDAPRQTSAHHWASADASYRFADQTKLRLAYNLQLNQRQEYDIRRGGRSAKPSLNLDLTTHDLRLELSPQRSGKWRGLYGLQGVSAANRNVAGTGVQPFVPYYNLGTIGAYAEQSRVGEESSVELAARGDLRRTEAIYFATQAGGERGRVTVDRNEFVGAASAGFVRYLSPKARLRTRLAYSSRTPNPAERFANGVHHALAVIERGDTSITVEHSLKALVGFGLEPKNGTSFHVAGFVQGFRGFIYAQQLLEPELTVRGAFPVLEYEQDDALLAGVDIDVHVPIQYFQIDAEASYLYGRRKGGLDLPDLAPLRVKSALSYSRSLGKRVKDYRLATSASYTARQWQVPPTLLAPAPGAYFLLGTEVSGHLAFGKQTLGVHLTATNLLNTPYRDYLDRLRFYADRPGRDVQLRLLYDF